MHTDIDEISDNKDLENDANKNIDLTNKKDDLLINNANNNTKNCFTKNKIKAHIKLDGKVPIIFASNQKPNIELNMTNGSVNITKDNTSYYVYDKEINNLGVRKVDIEEWYKEERISEEYFYKK